MSFIKQFGGKPTRELKARYAQSPNWQNGSFQNHSNTELTPQLTNIPGILYRQLTQTKDRAPKQPLPILPFDKNAFLASSESGKFIWYGHSVILLRLAEQTILIDPMFGPDTTPIAPIANKRFSENTLAVIDDFPSIDLVLLTHDHYDHLDYASIQKLKKKVKKYIVALGVKRHLVSWGVAADLITEMDWWNVQQVGDIKITFTPTRHFSGRGLTDRLMTLWGGWAFETSNEKIWFSGDGGYGEHFKEVGQRFGGFDFAFTECGQYNHDWHPVHLFPDESVQAALDAGVKKAMPVHWSGFNLSYQHTWTEPADEFVKAAQENNLEYALPRLGELFQIDTENKEKWWKNDI
ncbi:MAG: MBL fold metallo-hydrolase [Saprospiraceae bacterium]